MGSGVGGWGFGLSVPGLGCRVAGSGCQKCCFAARAYLNSDLKSYTPTPKPSQTVLESEGAP